MVHIETTGELAFAHELAALMRTPRLRTITEFAEQEIILPDGPYAGRRFRGSRAPAARLLFQEWESGRWQRSFITGPNQDGKSLIGFVIPTLYKIFERRETVVMGVPSGEIAADKWSVNLLPAIRASRYRDLLPTRGQGSRGGDVTTVEFKHGPVLRFMTGGGDDQSRASFTSPNLVVSETDGFDEVGGRSREGDKFSQLERRTLAFGERARTIAECTVSIEKGRTWQEYEHGTKSRIVLPCPHCSVWVTPEREHFVGWQTAETEQEAVANAHLVCPECGAAWSNDERLAANERAVLVHRGQEVTPEGKVVGPLPATNTLGFRWTVVNSVLNPQRLPMVGGIEWKAKRAADEEAADRDVSQSQWATPTKPSKLDLSQLDAFVIMRRTLRIGRGICPDGTQAITVGIDIGKRLCHWTAVAWRANATPHVIDYGRIEVPSDQMAEEDAILLALRDWRDEQAATGWKCGDATMPPTLAFVDRGNWGKTIQRFVDESGPPFFAAWGYGIGQRREGQYKRQSGSKVVWSKDGYSLIQSPEGEHYLEIKADQWKTWLHARVKTPIDKPGALTLFDSADHLSYAKHLTAEKQVEEFDPHQGTVTRWEAVSRNNHWLDATTLACVAGYEAGMRLTPEPEPEPPPAPRAPAPPVQSFVTSHRGRH